MKKLFSYCFDKWWIIPLFSAFLIGLSFIFDSIWLVITGIMLVTISVIYQFFKKGWKIGCLSGLTMLAIIALSAVWFYFQLFPSPWKTHKQYSKLYENKTEIQRILGVEIPKFRIVNSRIKHFNVLDYEFEVQSKLKFYAPPDDKFYNLLDSICSLPMPEELDENSSYFYYGLENIYRCWSKDENKYKYARNTDFGEKFLHSKDAYFYFEIIRGSKKAEIEYGNY